MKLQGGIYINDSGLARSIGAMHLQSELLDISSQNVSGFDKIGYQRKEPVVSSFAEVLGVHALSSAVDEQVGRIFVTSYPLDVAINTKGYFQFVEPDGSIKLSRDGRFKLNKNGELLSLEGQNVLSSSGDKIKFSKMPDKVDDIKISQDGQIQLFNPKTRKLETMATLGVVSSNGNIVDEVDVRQGFLEASNVSIAQEFLEMMPVRRNFQANRQLFMIQSSNLSNAIQQLGGA